MALLRIFCNFGGGEFYSGTAGLMDFFERCANFFHIGKNYRYFFAYFGRIMAIISTKMTIFVVTLIISKKFTGYNYNLQKIYPFMRYHSLRKRKNYGMIGKKSRRRRNGSKSQSSK